MLRLFTTFATRLAAAGVCLTVLPLASAAAPAAGTDHRVHTRVEADGTIDRSLFQETDDTPAEARAAKRWKESRYASHTVRSTGWRGLRVEKIAPPYASDPKRAFFSASGRFASVKGVPDHFRLAVPGGEGSRLVRELVRTDLVLVTEYRWRETLTSGISRADMKKARAELADLLVPLAEEIFRERWGKEHDGAKLFAAARSGGKDWAFEVMDQFYDGMAAPGKLEGKLEKVFAAWRAGLKRRGLELKDGDDPASLWMQVARRERALVRRRDGKDAPFPLEELTDETTLAVAQKVIARRFGGMKGLEKKALPLLARMFGPCAIEAARWLDGGLMPRTFSFALALPGEIVETNGGPPAGPRGGMCCAPPRREELEPELSVESTVHWSFSSVETYPIGHTMAARSLLGHEALQKRLFGRNVLNTPAKAKAYADLVRGSDRLLAAVRACRAEGRTRPLHAYLAEARRQGAAEVARTEKLLRLLGEKGL